MAKVTIGGEEFVLSPLKFKQLKKAYPLILRNQELDREAEALAKETGKPKQVDPIGAMDNAIAILAIALERDHPEMNADKIEDEITLAECASLNEAIVDLITESGFEVARPGEGEAAEGEASLSTETLTD
jgi:hypothetical protein